MILFWFLKQPRIINDPLICKFSIQILELDEEEDKDEWRNELKSYFCYWLEDEHLLNLSSFWSRTSPPPVVRQKGSNKHITVTILLMAKCRHLKFICDWFFAAHLYSYSHFDDRSFEYLTSISIIECKVANPLTRELFFISIYCGLLLYSNTMRRYISTYS